MSKGKEQLDGEDWKEFHRQQHQRKQNRAERIVEELKQVCEDLEMSLEEINNYGTQFRIAGELDIYPINKKWHNITTGERGTLGFKPLRSFIVGQLK